MSFNRSGYIGRAPGDSSITIARKTYEPTGVQTDFTFSAGYDPGYCDVYLNGIRLVSGNDYTASNGSTVGLTTYAISGDILEIVAYKAFNLGQTVSDITGDLTVSDTISALNVSASSSITGTLYGDGSNITGLSFAGAGITQYIDANSLTVTGTPGLSTITRLGATNAVVTGIITANGLAGNVTGAACTFTTGTFNGNVTIGGTLSYQDVTNVDALGIVTARAGVNVSGGQLQVGVAYSVGAAGVSTGLGFVAGTSGINAEAGTSNFGALNVGNAGEFKVGTAVTISSTSGVSTFANDVVFVGAGGKNVEWDKSNGAFELNDDTRIKIGDSADLSLYHDGSNSYIQHGNQGNLRYQSGNHDFYNQAGDEFQCRMLQNGAVSLYYDSSVKLATTNEGAQITGFTSTTAGLGVTGGMWEGAFIKAGKLSDNLQIGISTSNIHVFTTTETTTATPNIRWDDTYALSSKMKVGDAVTVTIVTTAASAGYAAAITIDGNAVTEEWNGGSAPSAGGSGGYDVYTYTLIRKAAGTGDTGWITLANVSNFA